MSWSIRGALITAQRIGAAVGIAAISTVLFGSGPAASSSGHVMPQLAASAQRATAFNLLFIAAAFPCALLLPASLDTDRAAENS